MSNQIPSFHYRVPIYGNEVEEEGEAFFALWKRRLRRGQSPLRLSLIYPIVAKGEEECEEKFFFFHRVPRQRDEDKEEIYLFDRLVFDSTNKVLFAFWYYYFFFRKEAGLILVKT